MGFEIKRKNGDNYADNIVNPALSFNTGTWTVASGTGTAMLDADNVFQGEKSLKIENTTPVSSITVTNSSQDTTIDIAGSYQLSWHIKKNIAQEVREGAVLVYKNTVLLDTQSFTLGSTTEDEDDNDTWLRFQGDQTYTFIKGDIITFQIRLSGATTTELTTALYVDGLMLNQAGRKNSIVPDYVIPKDMINRLENIPAPPTADGNYQLTVASGVYTWTTIV